MKQNEQQTPTIITAPAGEWQQIFLTWMQLAGLDVISPKNREYVAQVRPNRVFRNPLTVALVRATDATELMQQNPSVAAAITGTDIAYEQRVSLENIFPVNDLAPWLPPILLRLLATPIGLENGDFRSRAYRLEVGMSDYTPSEQITAKIIASLEGSDVYTSRPRRTRKYFGDADIRLLGGAGKLEGLWRINPKAAAIADITDSGATAKANGLAPIDTIEAITGLGLVKSPQISVFDQAVVTNFIDTLTKLKKVWRPESSEAQLYRVGNISYFRITGLRKDDVQVPVPVFFSQYLQTENQARLLLGSEATTIRLDDISTKELQRRLEPFASPAILDQVKQALQLGGYVLLPNSFQALESYRAIPNRFVGVH